MHWCNSAAEISEELNASRYNFTAHQCPKEKVFIRWKGQDKKLWRWLKMVNWKGLPPGNGKNFIYKLWKEFHVDGLLEVIFRTMKYNCLPLLHEESYPASGYQENPRWMPCSSFLFVAFLVGDAWWKLSCYRAEAENRTKALRELEEVKLVRYSLNCVMTVSTKERNQLSVVVFAECSI